MQPPFLLEVTKLRSFSIPFEFEHEEKLFWNMSQRQLVYMGIFIATFFLCITVPIFSWILRALIVLLVLTVCSLCAFLKVDGVYFDKFVMIYFTHKFRNKKFLNERS